MSQSTIGRTGGILAVTGAVAGLVGNLVHPRFNSDDVDTYRSIATSSRFRTADVFILLAFILIAAAMVAFSRVWELGRGAGAAYYGRIAAIVGGALGLVGIAIETLAFKQQADAFAAADGHNVVSAFWATNAVDHVNSAMLDVTTIVLLGLAPCLIATAQLANRATAPRLSIAGLVGGAVCVVVGIVALLISDQGDVDIPFLIGSLLVTLWIFATGVHLLRTPDRSIDLSHPTPTATEPAASR